MIPGITASLRRVSRLPSGDDPYWENVVLLAHFDGDAVDVKGGTLSPVGTIGFTAGKFGQGMRLATGNSGAAEPAARAALDLPSDFTVEGWANLDSTATGAFINRFDSTGNGWQIYVETTGKLSFWQYVGGNLLYNMGVDIRDGAWHHIAVSRQGQALRMFLDGAMIGSVNTASDFTSPTARISIGFQAQGGARYPLRGTIDDVRITKGVARYTANFTPPEAEFPNS